MRRPLALCLLLLLLAGCGTRPAMQETPKPTVTPTATETPAVTDHPAVTDTPATRSPVYTDWSKLTPYEPLQPVYSYHPNYSADGLAAGGDYGTLLPYIGAYATMEMYVIDRLPLYGLVTDKGELVCGSVYTYISFQDDFLVLGYADPDLGNSCTIAAPDGAWVRALDGSHYVAKGAGLLMTAGADGSLDLWNSAGEIAMHFDSSLFTPWLGETLYWDWDVGPFVDWMDDKVGYVTCYNLDGAYIEGGIRLYLDFTSGAVTDTPPDGYPAEIDYASIPDTSPEPPVVEGVNYLSPFTDGVTGETYFHGHYRSDDGEQSFDALFDSKGELLVKNADMGRFEAPFVLRAGLYSAVEDGSFFCYRSLADGHLVFRYPMQTNSD